MPSNRRPHTDEDDAEYVALLKQIRFSEYAAVCAQSGMLQAAATELRCTAKRLIGESVALRRAWMERRGR